MFLILRNIVMGGAFTFFVAMVAWLHCGMVAWWYGGMWHGGMWHGGMVAWWHCGMVALWHGGMVASLCHRYDFVIVMTLS
jgi:hypothetical protein